MSRSTAYARIRKPLAGMAVAVFCAFLYPHLALADPGDTLVASAGDYQTVSYRRHGGRTLPTPPEAQRLPDAGTMQRLGQLGSEVQCLARTIYFEARGEGEEGQRAVGHVVMNRVASPKYPDSVCAVVHQGGEARRNRCQFSWWCDGRSDEPTDRKSWIRALRLAYEVYLGVSDDPTGGALWYHAVYASPYWKNLLVQGDRIGQHIFYHSPERKRELL